MQKSFRSVLTALLLAFATMPFAVAQDDSPVFAVAYIEVIPSMTGQASELLQAHAKTSQAREGNLRFQLLQRIGRPNHFAILDAWQGGQHRDEHTAASKAFREELDALLYSPYDERKSVPAFATSAGGGDGEVYALTHIDFAPPALEQGLKFVEALVASSRREDGAVDIGVIVQQDRRNHMTLFEVWSSAATHEAHITSEQTMYARDGMQSLIGALYDERLYRRL
jgi:quinol monooxygenase YgiN